MVGRKALFVYLVAACQGLVLCKPPPPKPTAAATSKLPVTGSGKELPPPAQGATLLKVAIGHGVQDYDCASAQTSPAKPLGAHAVLYDATSFLPDTPGTGLSAAEFEKLPSEILHTADIPLNLAAANAKSPKAAPLPERSYVPNSANPFGASTGVKLNGKDFAFLGTHFFQSEVPIFDLSAAGLKADVAKKAAVNAPGGADKGLLNTGAVAWLQLDDSGKGLSKGVGSVYRVLTAGGSPQACSESGAGLGSVPYAALYFFFS